MTEHKADWTVRARQFGNQLTTFLAEHGTHLGIAGGVVLALGGTATLVASGLAQSVASVEAAQSASTAMYIGSFLNMALGATAEFISGQKQEAFTPLFAEPETSSDPRSSQRGATPINDALLQDPDFRVALLVITNKLQGEPETRAGITDILRNNPGARQVLVELYREAVANQSANHASINQNHNTPDIDDDLSGPSI